jgi:putative phage-type endonuclease
MTTEYITHDNHADWLADRLGAINSTEASALFGLSPYETLFSLWQRKRHGQRDEVMDNDRMQAGRHIEPAIASLVAERYGVVVEPFKVYALDRSTRMGSSFDYRIIGVTDAPVDDTSLREMFAKHGPGILECKNVDGRIFRANWKDGEAPGHIEVQVQHQLALTDIPWSVIAGLPPVTVTVWFLREVTWMISVLRAPA